MRFVLRGEAIADLRQSGNREVDRRDEGFSQRHFAENNLRHKDETKDGVSEGGPHHSYGQRADAKRHGDCDETGSGLKNDHGALGPNSVT